MANIYKNEINFIKNNIDFLKNNDLEGLCNTCINAGLDWGKVIYILFETDMSPLDGLDIVETWVFNGFNFPKYEVTIPMNIKHCTIINMIAKSLKFANPDTTLKISNSTIDTLILPKHFDASGQNQNNYIGENVNSVIVIPNGMKKLGDIINKNQSGLQISTDAITQSKMLIHPNLYTPGLKGQPGWNLNDNTVIVY